MQTPDYLDAARHSLEVPSDYALQKALGISRAQISRYRNMHDTLSDEIAAKIAKITNIPLPRILADCHMERATNSEIKAAWAEIQEKFSIAKEGFNFLISHARSIAKCVSLAMGDMR